MRDPRTRLRGQGPPQDQSQNRPYPQYMTPQNLDDSALNDSRFSMNESRIQFMKPTGGNRPMNKRVAFEEDDFGQTTEAQQMIQKPATHNFKPKSNTSKLVRRIQVNFGPGAVQNKMHKFTDNYVSTTKY